MNIYLMKKPKRINAVSITLAILAAIIVYAVWFLVPAFWPIFQLTGIMKGACNSAYRQLDDEKVMEDFLREAHRTKLKLSRDNFRLTRLPYTEEELRALSPEGQAQDLFRRRGKTCVMELRYQDDYEWPLIGKRTKIPFERKITTSLETVDYNKACTCVTTSQP